MNKPALIAVILVAAALRLYALREVPPSASLDEASIGWNAYSILHTGRDEYGTGFPMLLRAYDDWRPALYVYLVVPLIGLLGLGTLAVRLPSVLLSLCTVYLTYAIGHVIGMRYLKNAWLGFVASVLVAVSPWHMYISRLGHEANLGLTLTVTGLFFLVRYGVYSAGRDIVLSGLFLGLSLHGYQSQKIVVPILAVVACTVFWKRIRTRYRYWLAACIAGAVFAVPALFVTFSPQGISRFAGTSAFGINEPPIVAARDAYTSARDSGDRFGMLLSGAVITNSRVFVSNYVSHFAPLWLMRGGSREAHKVPETGLLYPVELPFILLGVYALFVTSLPRSIAVLLLAYLLAAPVPAAMTTQSPHAMRAFTMIPALQVIAALGFVYVLVHIPKRMRYSAVTALCIVLAVSVGSMSQRYFVQFPQEQSDSFSYALHRAIRYAAQNEPDFESVQFAHMGSLYQSYMFFLYSTGYDPASYLAQGGTVSGGYQESHRFGKFAFGYLPTSGSELRENTLYFYPTDALPDSCRVLERFADLDGTERIAAVIK